jgi:hypothetical protein
MPVTQSERNVAGLLVHCGVGIGLVWFLDDPNATHNANPEEDARTRRRLQAKMDDADRMRASPARGNQRNSLVAAASRVLPAADWSATPRRFHGYRGPHHTIPSAPRSAGQPGPEQCADRAVTAPRADALMGTSAGRLGGSGRDGQATLRSRHLRFGRNLQVEDRPEIGRPRLDPLQQFIKRRAVQGF